MSFVTELATFHINVLSFLVPILIGASLIFHIICTRSSFKKNLATEKIVQSNGPYLFVTAHPDDECMFFAPSLIQLANHDPHNVHLLCVTTGEMFECKLPA